MFEKGNKFGNRFQKGHKVEPEWILVGMYKQLYWRTHVRDRKQFIAQVKIGMARVEVRDKLKLLNSRKRKPMSDKHKTKISKALAGRLPSNMKFSQNGWDHIQKGEYGINGREMYFRSKWEANVALYLDFLKKQGNIKDWKFENKWFVFDKIRHGTTRYLPDFEVTNNDGSVEYWEVKGYMDSRSKTKLKRMKKYYPEVKLVLIDGEAMKALGKWKKLLNFY
jgi:hypothetical protein